MCCEECPKYDKCDEEGHLKDNCCSKCPEYDACTGSDEKEKHPYADSYQDSDYDNF